jgi:hypothetical protein
MPPPLPEPERGAWTLPHPSALDPSFPATAPSEAADSGVDADGPTFDAEGEASSPPSEPVSAPRSEPMSAPASDRVDDPRREDSVQPGLASLVVPARESESIEEEPMPELASRVTVPLFERELVRLSGELALLVYEAGRLFGLGDRTTRLLMREVRRLEHPALLDALLGEGARGVRVDRALMRMIAEAQATLDEWRAHAEGEGELLEMEIRALRKALDDHALTLCRATLAAADAVGIHEGDWADYWAGLAEDADDERLAHDNMTE